jgi:hypothetical protein
MVSIQDQEFLRVAVAAAPRVAELIAEFPAEHRIGAFEIAERYYREAATQFGCTNEAAFVWVSLIMRNVEKRVRTAIQSSERSFSEPPVHRVKDSARKAIR